MALFRAVSKVNNNLLLNTCTWFTDKQSSPESYNWVENVDKAFIIETLVIIFILRIEYPWIHKRMLFGLYYCQVIILHISLCDVSPHKMMEVRHI